MKKVTRKERGWAGHFFMAGQCCFRRNTLLTCGEDEIVVSTVGNLFINGKKKMISGYCFETMAFRSDKSDTKYHDADVSKNVRFLSNNRLDDADDDNLADEMHETVVKEIAQKLIFGIVDEE